MASELLERVLDWIRASGGSVGDESVEPIELLLGGNQFFLGVLSHEKDLVEISCPLSLGEDDSQSPKLLQEVAARACGSLPEGVLIEVTESNGLDVWAVQNIHSDDKAGESLERSLRVFVDFCSRAVDKISDVLHPLSIKPSLQTEGVLSEFQQLIGIEPIFSKVEEFVALASIAKKRGDLGLASLAVPSHLVFTGNPGTGKTTVARLMGRLFKELGLLPSGHLIEARPSDLIGEYVGQTVPKTERVIEKASGGVLFIDEAYAILGNPDRNQRDPFGEECIATLLQAMENMRGEFSVIIAGYTDEITGFVLSNPGLTSRFDQFWHFRDYSSQELSKIFLRFAASSDYELSEGVLERVQTVFDAMPRNRHFGNARAARNLFQAACRRQAVRLMKAGETSREMLMALTAADVDDFRHLDHDSSGMTAGKVRWNGYL